MLIRIINGTYGYRPMLPNGKISEYVVPTTRNDPPIYVGKKEAERLVREGIAEYVTVEPVATDAAPPEPESPNGEMPSAEGGESALHDAGIDDADLVDDEEITVYTTEMKADELRAAMRERGLTIRVGMTKAEMVQALNGVNDDLPEMVPQDVVEE